MADDCDRDDDEDRMTSAAAAGRHLGPINYDVHVLISQQISAASVSVMKTTTPAYRPVIAQQIDKCVINIS